MDQDLKRLYKKERQNATLAIVFTILAIVIASLGLFGLTSFTVEQRTKEIGIRKALGASVKTIFTLISKEIIIGNNVWIGRNCLIQPGTIIRGDKLTQGTLIITRGAKIIANGTATNPIVMTSNEAVGAVGIKVKFVLP